MRAAYIAYARGQGIKISNDREKFDPAAEVREMVMGIQCLTLRQYDAVVVSARAHLQRQMALSFALRDFVDGQPTSIWLGATPDLPRVLIRCYQAMLRAMEISGSSMLRLTEPVGDHVRDCFPIARSIIEIGVNLAYIAAMGEKAAEQARRHSLWRSVTDLERRREFGALKLHHRARSLDELDDIPGMRDVVDWIARQGSDVPRRREWTALSVPQRIAVVLEKLGAGTALADAYFHLYGDASEIVHGSVYGCFLSPGGTIRDQEIARHDQAFALLLSCGMVINDAVVAIGTAHELDQVLEAAKSYHLALADELAFKQVLQEVSSKSEGDVM
jgi:Family of unknown function (DUF5677)